MGCIFKPEPLSWEDIDGGRGELITEEIEAFISDYCYQDEPADYGDDGELANELVFFSEAWEKVKRLGFIRQDCRHIPDGGGSFLD